jgi:hypothetical protein
VVEGLFICIHGLEKCIEATEYVYPLHLCESFPPPSGIIIPNLEGNILGISDE